MNPFCPILLTQALCGLSLLSITIVDLTQGRGVFENNYEVGVQRLDVLKQLQSRYSKQIVSWIHNFVVNPILLSLLT